MSVIGEDRSLILSPTKFNKSICNCYRGVSSVVSTVRKTPFVTVLTDNGSPEKTERCVVKLKKRTIVF